MGNDKNRRKNSHSGGGANESSPRRNDKKGGNRAKGRNNHSDNEGTQNKGRVPQEFLECRICEGKYHWESDCRKNPAGEGKRGRDSAECRECGGNHWEDQCRSWKSRNGGSENGNHKKGNTQGDSTSSSDSDAGKCSAPTGEDITQFFPNGKFPNRPCRKCKESGHWNNACEKEGFHPVSNPNPGAKGGRRVSLQDEQGNGQVNSGYNQYQAPPGTPVRTASYTEVPPVSFGHAEQRFDSEMEMEFEHKIRIQTHPNTPPANPIPPTTIPNLPIPNPISLTPPLPIQTIPPTPTPLSTKPATALPSAHSVVPPATNPTIVLSTAGYSRAPIPSGALILICIIHLIPSIPVQTAIGKATR
ncbi:hypothetical protein BPOR_0485g00010 [Botrytis porri]|uniref:CCHC-type domain-containing protein n=1 Tax=Botrytis porri TaxID=87229 RepID=A0A4Z1KEJ5_9HELO|nr:hypothetical protein BPOR_0485g00010 [Botrytis porri]